MLTTNHFMLELSEVTKKDYGNKVMMHLMFK